MAFRSLFRVSAGLLCIALPRLAGAEPPPDQEASAAESRPPALLEPALRSQPTTPPLRMTLQQALDQALSRNPTLENALLEVRRADAVVRETKAAWFPTLYGNGGFTHLDHPRVEDGATILAQNELALNLTLTVPVLAARQWLNTEEARLAEESQTATSRDVRRLVAYATAQAYLAVYAQKFVIEVDERARENARQHASYTKQRYVGGVGNHIDQVRAEQELATDTAIVAQAYAQLAQVQEGLGILVGGDAPVDAAGDPTLAEAPTLADGLAGAEHRTDVVAAGKRLEQAKKVVRDDWADYAPYLAGVAQPFYQDPPIPTMPLTGYQLEALLTVPLYDGGLRYGQERERRALRDEARVGYEAQLRQARSDVRNAFEAMRRADEALGSSRDAARLAGQALDLANQAYRAGAVTDIEVIDAERTARDADTQAEIAADASRQARLTMLTMTGRFP